MENSIVSFSLLELFQLGGVFMWPLLLYSIATLTIGLERLIFFIYNDRKIDDIGSAVTGYLAGGDYAGAQEYLKPLTKRRMGARIILALVQRAEPVEGRAFSERHVERAAETEAMTCTNSLENGMNFLVALGSLSPLTGFLGTVAGMIGAFRSIAEATEVNAQIVANGIYEALITTVAGLIIAIIAMIFHSIFSHFIDKFTADIEKTCSDLIAEAAARQT